MGLIYGVPEDREDRDFIQKGYTSTKDIEKAANYVTKKTGSKVAGAAAAGVTAVASVYANSALRIVETVALPVTLPLAIGKAIFRKFKK